MEVAITIILAVITGPGYFGGQCNYERWPPHFIRTNSASLDYSHGHTARFGPDTLQHSHPLEPRYASATIWSSHQRELALFYLGILQ